MNWLVVLKWWNVGLWRTETFLYGLSSHQTMRLRGMSDAFQSATSNPSKYRGFQMSKKNFLGPEKCFFSGAPKKTFRGPKSFFLTSGFRKL